MGNVSTVLESAAEEMTHSKSRSPNDLITRKMTHGCNLFIQNPEARQIFVDYLTSGEWIDKLSSNSDFVRSVQSAAMDDASLAPQDGKHFNGYSLPDGAEEDDYKSYFTDGTDPASVESEVDTIKVIETCFTQSALRPVLLASVFPLFVESEEYQRWVTSQTDKETNSATESYAYLANVSGKHKSANPEATAAEQAQMEKEGKEREARLDELFVPNDRRIKDIVSQAMRSVDKSELNELLLSGDWLSGLMASVEDLPLCVSLATARNDRPGFPLVYVNKAFESTTLYSREEIVGHNCKFLQTNKSEPEQILKMTKALKSAQPVKVVLTNKRKDGTEFINMLAMKPVFDDQGVYAYVIGVQYDITNKAASLKQMKQVNDLLSILPNCLK